MREGGLIALEWFRCILLTAKIDGLIRSVLVTLQSKTLELDLVSFRSVVLYMCEVVHQIEEDRKKTRTTEYSG